MEQVQTQTSSVDITVANSWTRLGATAVAHMTEHLYVGVITVAARDRLGHGIVNGSDRLVGFHALSRGRDC